MDIEKEIKNLFFKDNNYIFAYANIKGLVNKRFKKYNSAIAIGRKLDHDIVDELTNGPTQKYYDHYHDINQQLAEIGRNICKLLKEAEIDHIFIQPTFKDDEIDESWRKNLRTDFSHKMAATRAGLGWIGKTDLLISHKFGPRLRLCTILCCYDFNNYGEPISKSKCGDCNICVEKCPAKAATGLLWEKSIDRDKFYDAFKCRKMCRFLTKRNLGKDDSICGICIECCPIGL